ncbi:MAG TPA: GNAT family N-acetyltransferase [Mycobacteriales bacterium]|nr:GNAT family N-acetyltransferase [Mycobacteriales bacterium]
MDDVRVRPLSVDDVPAAQEVSYHALREAGRHYGWDMPELDDGLRDRGRRRLAHCVAHDPAGAFVAECAGEIVGIGLATRRGPLWFLSLLAVATRMQSRGVGRRLLEATMSTFGGTGAICASDDPKALRRYRAAGFELRPTFTAKGTLDRARAPAIDDVRSGSYTDDRDFVEAIARSRRGAPHGPDLEFMAASGRGLFITEDARGRGYLVASESGPVVLGATTEDAAARLLWTALAETTEPEVEVRWMCQQQQWALDVVLEAGLAMRPAGTRCVAGPIGPMSPYLPNGGLG